MRENQEVQPDQCVDRLRRVATADGVLNWDHPSPRSRTVGLDPWSTRSSCEFVVGCSGPDSSNADESRRPQVDLVAVPLWAVLPTLICFGLASSALGRVRVSTPLSNWVWALSATTGAESLTVRWNCP